MPFWNKTEELSSYLLKLSLGYQGERDIFFFLATLENLPVRDCHLPGV